MDSSEEQVQSIPDDSAERDADISDVDCVQVALREQRLPSKALQDHCPGAVLLETARSVWSYQLRKLQDVALCRRFENRPLTSTLPLVLACMSMGTLYVSFVLMYLPATGLAIYSIPSVFFHATFSLTLCSYHQGIITDPGSIPAGWEGDPEGQPRFVSEGMGTFHPIERKQKEGRLRYCTKERKFKPDRTHFCSAVSRNVLRMDHFCPWGQVPVGHYNHKFFMLGMFYLAMTTNFVELKFICALTAGGFSAGQTFLLWQGLTLSTVMSTLLNPYFGFHCWLLSRNLTTIEFVEKRRNKMLRYISPYDLGLFKNISSVMGQNWLLWLLPIGQPPGNGVDWEVNDNDTPLVDFLDGAWVRRLDGAVVGDILKGLVLWDESYSQPPSELEVREDGVVRMRLHGIEHIGRFHEDFLVASIRWSGGEIWIRNGKGSPSRSWCSSFNRAQIGTGLMNSLHHVINGLDSLADYAVREVSSCMLPSRGMSQVGQTRQKHTISTTVEAGIAVAYEPLPSFSAALDFI